MCVFNIQVICFAVKPSSFVGVHIFFFVPKLLFLVTRYFTDVFKSQYLRLCIMSGLAALKNMQKMLNTSVTIIGKNAWHVKALTMIAEKPVDGILIPFFTAK